MIDTIHLMPPDAGPRANPVLFGVAAALAEHLPLALVLPRGMEPVRAQPCASPEEGAGRAAVESPVRMAATKGA